jgi:hypothetical protein
VRATRTGRVGKAGKDGKPGKDGKAGKAGKAGRGADADTTGERTRPDGWGAARVADRVPVIEPSLPPRIRRPGDATRLLVALAGLGIVLLLPSIARQTTTGIQSDITHGTAQTPHFLLVLANLVSTFGLLAIPVAFAIERLFRRDRMRVAVGLLAAVIALGVTLALDWWVATGPSGLVDYLAWPRRSGDTVPDPLHTDLTPVIAYVTAVRLGGRPRWQAVTWTVIALAALAALAAGYASPLALAVTYLIGRAIGYGCAGSGSNRAARSGSPAAHRRPADTSSRSRPAGRATAGSASRCWTATSRPPVSFTAPGDAFGCAAAARGGRCAHCAAPSSRNR